MGEAEGVASKVAVKVPVRAVASALFCQALPAVTHTGALTVKVIVVACVKLALVPAMVSGYVPAGVELVVETLNVEEPEPPLIEVGVNVPEAPAGTLLTL